MNNLEKVETRVYISTTVDFKTRVRNWWKKLRLKAALQHFGLLFFLMVYTVFGGLCNVERLLMLLLNIFIKLYGNQQDNEDEILLYSAVNKFIYNSNICLILSIYLEIQTIGFLIKGLNMPWFFLQNFIFLHFEYPAEITTKQNFLLILSEERQYLLDVIQNNEDIYTVNSTLSEYEKLLEKSFEAGISINSENDVKWTPLKAVFFSSTVLTTIGYGNIVPVTTEGQAFCIAFALVGIPLTLTVIADWGRLFASTLSTLVHHIPPLPSRYRNAMVARRTSSYALSAICFLFVYLAAGAALFVIWEEDWTFFQGFYFCFITMTTIGFGDFVPKQPKYMLLCTLYILVGLALTSTIIELVRRQYAQSWRQLRALRGPLAENFRKFADNAPGLDVLAFQQDLMKVLTVVTMPKRTPKTEKKIKQQEWENAIESVIRDITQNATNEHKTPPLVQIVIYESSV